jgi:isoleucyl-tRNA synthetase
MSAALQDSDVWIIMRADQRSFWFENNPNIRIPLGFQPSERRTLEDHKAVLLEELNIKDLAFADDTSPYIGAQVLLNKATLGPKYGSRLAELEELAGRPEAFQQLKSLFTEAEGQPVVWLGDFELGEGDLTLSILDRPGFSHAMDTKDLKVGEGEGIKARLVAIDTNVTPALADEGLARELVHRLQTMRRNAGFDIADRITTYYQGGEDIRRVMAGFGDYLRQETLSRELVEGEPPADAYQEEHTVDGQRVRLAVRRI